MAGTIRSGRLWCGAGRYRISIVSVSPSWVSTARRSPASAPQAIKSGFATAGSAPDGRPGRLGDPQRPPGTDELLGGLGRDRRVAAVGVGPDRPPELLVERGATAQHDVAVAQAPLAERVDHDLHVRH